MYRTKSRIIRHRDGLCAISQIIQKPVKDSIIKSKINMERVHKDSDQLCKILKKGKAKLVQTYRQLHKKM